MFFKKIKLFFAHKKLKKPPSKIAQKNSNPLFFPSASTAQTAQTEEFIFQNVAYRPTVYRTGVIVKRFHKVTTPLCTKGEGSQVSEQHRNRSSHQRLSTRVETTEYIKQISNCGVSRYLNG